MNAPKFRLFVSALVAVLCVAWGGTASAQADYCPESCTDRIDDLDAKIKACCEPKKTEATPPSKPVKPYKIICGYGTNEFKDDGQEHLRQPGNLHCTCKNPKEGESPRILVTGAMGAESRIEWCAPKDAVTKAYVDGVANGKVSAEDYIKFQGELKNKMVTVKDTLFALLFHLAKVEQGLADVRDDVDDIKVQLPYLEKKIDAIAYHRVDAGGGVSGILGSRNLTFFGGAGADLYLIGRFNENIGIAIDADGGFFGSNTTGIGWRLKVSAGPQWTLDPSGDGGENRHELGFGAAGQQFGRSSHKVNDAEGNFYGYGVGPELWYQLNITDFFNMRLEAGVGFGEVAGYGVDDGKAFNGFGVTPYAGLKFRFGSGAGDLAAVEKPAKPKPRPKEPTVLDDVGEDGLQKVQTLPEFKESIEARSKASAETKTETKPSK